MIAASDTIAGYLRLRFPDCSVATVPCAIDRTLFRPADKQLQIAFAPHKRKLESKFIRDLLTWRLKGAAPMVEISNMTERDVAATLGRSAIFLSLNRLEGLGLMPLEAMAAGCLVAGFTGIGGREYATAGNGDWCDEDDMVGCVEALIRAIDLVRAGGAPYEARLRAGADTADRYSTAAFERRLVEFWQAEIAG